MQPVWTVIVVLVAFFLIFHVRNRKRRAPEAKVYARRIDGARVQAYLHPRVGAACLADHGIQFGTGFRRKEGPPLPHDESCRCKAAHFSFTSNEVFHGALRRPLAPDASIPGLSEADSVTLLDVLRSWDRPHPAGSPEQTLASVNWSRFSPARREALDNFLRERLDYLGARREPKALSPA